MQKEWGKQITHYPNVSCQIKGGRYSIEFLIDQRKNDLLALLVYALNTYEKNSDKVYFKNQNFKSMLEGNILTIQIDFEESIGNPKNKIISKGTIYISGMMNSERPNFKFVIERADEFSSIDLQAFVNVYRESNKPQANTNKQKTQTNQSYFANTENTVLDQKNSNQRIQALKKLEEFGVIVFNPSERANDLDWEYLAGYEAQKRDIEDTVLLALSHPEIYDEITQGTRMKVQANRPKAVLFEGPPGTGKTTSAKIIAQQVNIPLIYMPLESIMSKYYGESEKRFADIWDACKVLGKTIIFIDEIDAIAASRDDGMHEASRRILSTLLRKIDSFESTTDVLLICATNRKRDLDPAMLSRIDMSIIFELPDEISRSAIFQRYAKQLGSDELIQLAQLSKGMSGRNIADVCKDSERRWASKLIRKEVNEKLPNLQQYIESLQGRKNQNLA